MGLHVRNLPFVILHGGSDVAGRKKTIGEFAAALAILAARVVSDWESIDASMDEHTTSL